MASVTLALLTAATVVTTSACGQTMSRGASRGTILVGAGLMVTGAVLAAPQPGDSGALGDLGALDDDFSGFLPGSLLLVAGATLLAVGLTAREPSEAPPPYLLTMRPPTGQPIGSPALTAPLPAPLPAIATTAVVIRMARQVRAAVGRGDCAAARATLRHVEARDPTYAAALAAGPVLAPCRT